MTQTELTRASDLLESAADQTSDDEANDRLAELAEQVGDLAAEESRADHGRIARIQAAIDELGPSVDDDVGDTMIEARSELSSYREGLEGV